MGIRGSQTEKNLLKSFAGESQARNRYTYYSSQAKKEGYEQIAAIFEETANQEKEHAKRFFSYLEGGELEITAAFPAGIIGTTIENLKESIMGEHEEHSVLYPGFANIAEQEGFLEIANLWRKVSVAETFHEERYRKYLELLEKGEVFKSDHEVTWQCRNCCYTLKGEEAPEKCPACLHPKAYFQKVCCK